MGCSEVARQALVAPAATLSTVGAAESALECMMGVASEKGGSGVVEDESVGGNGELECGLNLSSYKVRINDEHEWGTYHNGLCESQCRLWRSGRQLLPRDIAV